MSDFTHFNEKGRAKMVDVGAKDRTLRTAVAGGRVIVNGKTFSLIKNGGMKKGDVLGTAQIAGIMAAKKTSEIIPMCHPIMLTSVDIDFELSGKAEHVDLELNDNAGHIDFELNDDNASSKADNDLYVIKIRATAKCQGVTGVEMEALTAVSAAALTIYDMCKAVQKDMIIDKICLLSKTGGKSGDIDQEDLWNIQLP